MFCVGWRRRKAFLRLGGNSVILAIEQSILCVDLRLNAVAALAEASIE
jgi:hypothetical protein